MEIGILGAGRIARSFARYVLQEGFQVKLSNSRGPSTLVDLIDELGVSASADIAREAAAAPIVLLAVPWARIQSALTGLKPWNGRILIDATNPYVLSNGDVALVDLEDRVSSEIVAALAPGARVVKALNNLDVELLEQGPSFVGARRIQFISGDDEGAKTEVATLFKSMGFAVIDLGSMRIGGRLQQAGGPLEGRDLLEYFHPRR
jgi:8-hydroxy-5-deazaflavin:NADPH oxidoreductase